MTTSTDIQGIRYWKITFLTDTPVGVGGIPAQMGPAAVEGIPGLYVYTGLPHGCDCKEVSGHFTAERLFYDRVKNFDKMNFIKMNFEELINRIIKKCLDQNLAQSNPAHSAQACSELKEYLYKVMLCIVGGFNALCAKEPTLIFIFEREFKILYYFISALAFTNCGYDKTPFQNYFEGKVGVFPFEKFLCLRIWSLKEAAEAEISDPAEAAATEAASVAVAAMPPAAAAAATATNASAKQRFQLVERQQRSSQSPPPKPSPEQQPELLQQPPKPPL
jgi:hypothetical protein